MCRESHARVYWRACAHACVEHTESPTAQKKLKMRRKIRGRQTFDLMNISRIQGRLMAARTLSNARSLRYALSCLYDVRFGTSLLSKALQDQRRCGAHTTVRGTEISHDLFALQDAHTAICEKSDLEWNSVQTSSQEAHPPGLELEESPLCR